MVENLLGLAPLRLFIMVGAMRRKSRERIMAFRLIASVFIALAVASAPALACKGREVLFEDKFQEEDPGWEQVSGLTMGGGKLELKPEEGKWDWSVYGGAAFKDADICADFVTPSARDATAAGLLFWSRGNDNWFALRINNQAEAQVLRLQGENFLQPVTWRAAPALKKEPNSVNQVRVVLKGNTGSAFLNDKLLANFKGVPPLGGQFGIIASSVKGQSSGWAMTSIVITKP